MRGVLRAKSRIVGVFQSGTSDKSLTIHQHFYYITATYQRISKHIEIDPYQLANGEKVEKTRSITSTYESPRKQVRTSLIPRHFPTIDD